MVISGSLAPIYDGLDAIAEPSQYIPPAAAEVKALLASTIAAGTSPSGKPWAPRKSDGGKPLQGAMAAVDVRAAGTTIVVELTGNEVFHHYGAGDSPVRQIIPTEIEEKLGAAIRRGAAKPFKERSK